MPFGACALRYILRSICKLAVSEQPHSLHLSWPIEGLDSARSQCSAGMRAVRGCGVDTHRHIERTALRSCLPTMKYFLSLWETAPTIPRATGRHNARGSPVAVLLPCPDRDLSLRGLQAPLNRDDCRPCRRQAR